MKRILTMAVASAFLLTVVAANAQTQPTPKPGGSAVTETTTKHKGAGPNTKSKKKTVIGSVKEYEAGKKIVVTGPKKKDYSFDLDENAAVTGDIAVGAKVKVTYTKSDTGQKATTVVPYGAMKKKSSSK